MMKKMLQRKEEEWKKNGRRRSFEEVEYDVKKHKDNTIINFSR